MSYDFDPENYLADVRVEVTELGGEEILLLHLPQTLAINEIKPEEDHRALAFVVNSPRGGIRSVSLDDVDDRIVEEGPLRWVALKNKYFLVAALAGAVDRPFGGLIAEPMDAPYSASLTATLPGRENVFMSGAVLGMRRAEPAIAHPRLAHRHVADVAGYAIAVARQARARRHPDSRARAARAGREMHGYSSIRLAFSGR